MANSYANLSKMTIDELKSQYDAIAGSSQVGLQFYRDEIARREAAEQNRRMEDYTRQVRDMTKWITYMTGAVLLLTIVMTAVTLIALLK